MTKRSIARMREKCIEAGMDGCITKPVRLDELRAVLDKCTSGGKSLED